MKHNQRQVSNGEPAKQFDSVMPGVVTLLNERQAAVGLVDPRVQRESVTLGKLIQTFVDRATVKSSTRKAYKQTTDSLLTVLGGATTLDAITPEHADVWRKSIADDGLSPATVAKRVYVARSIFRKAVKWKMVGENPFADVAAGSQRNPDRAFYVSQDVITALLHKCPDPFCRTVVGFDRRRSELM